jgi:hypothetical protein
MMVQKSYAVELIAGHRIARRGLAFLICEGEKNIDAKSVFHALKVKRERELRRRFDYWLDGGVNALWFHGWSNPTYKDCFVFKWKENKQNHRLYGFLCNPLSGYRDFQLCVLISHATKNTRETDPTELDRVNEIKDEKAVTEALTEAAKDINRQLPRR